ncbi:hypothetical protein JDS92_01535 [Bacillus cereus group sp. N12]|uniref:hypothetical protein n=1 Tax=Bacillus cereus group sp. N12 TaxID=2794586 RepID=UPI0018F5FAE6|nr:hypothetical protein [Bacillus cereus group sp. N12]MBJ8074035.1 hypothetical protein [Bacillus cereus group sp. N12]
MNYYQVNITYLDNGQEFTTQQCLPMEGEPIIAQMRFKRLIKKYTEEAITSAGGELEEVKTKRVTKEYYEANKHLQIFEGARSWHV